MAETLEYLVRLRGGREAAADADMVAASQDRIAASTRRVGEESGIASTAFAKGFGTMRTVIRTVTGVVGLAGIGFGLGELIKNAETFQNASAQLGASIRTNVTNPSREMYSTLLEFADRFTSRGGFAPPDEIKAMTQLLRITHNTTRTMQDLTLATNIARGSHKDLATAARAVAMVEGGRLTMLTRLGIVLPKGTTAQQAYAILLRRYAGATEAYNRTAEGAMTNFEHALDVVGEKIGLMLVPYLTMAFTWLAKVIDMAQRGQGIFHLIGQATHWVGANFHYVTDAVKDAYRWVRRQIDLFREGDPRVRAIAIGVGAVAVGFTALQVALKIYAAAQWLANAALAAFPLTLVIVGLAAIATGLVYAYEKVGWFRNAVDGLWANVLGGARKVIDWFKGADWHVVGDVIAWPFTRLPKIVEGVFAAVKTTVTGWISDLINAYNLIPGLPNITNPYAKPNLPTQRDMAPPGANTISPAGTDTAPPGANRGRSISPPGTNRAPASITPHGADMAPHAARMSSIHIHIDGREIAHVTRRQIMRAMAANA